MPRHKPAWRRVLNARYLRWLAVRAAVSAFPWLGRRLGYFPRTVGLIEAADTVLADEHAVVPPDLIAPDRGFLQRCLPHDAADPAVDLDRPIATGQRTVVIRAPWIDMKTGTILLPGQARTVMLRGAGNWNVGSVAWGRSVERVPGRVVAPLPTANYFHSLIENGLWLNELFASGIAGDTPVSVVRQPDRSRVEGTLYRALAARYGLTLRHVAPPALVQPDAALVHFPRNAYWEWPPLDRAAADRLADLFADAYGPPDDRHGPDLFLSRGGSKLRRLTNEDAVWEMLAGQGFERFVATDDNHSEQIARFRAARRVVSVHGAGLTNILFCRPGAKVIELFPATQIKSPYWWLCRMLDLGHVPLVGGPGDYHLAFEMPVEQVRAAL